MKRLWVIIFFTMFAPVFADTFTSRATVVTQDGELSTGQVVYLVSIERAGAEYMVHRFCILAVDKYREYRFVYDTPSGSDVIHVPQNVIDIADEKTNRMLEEKYHFYKPQVFVVGVLNEVD